jgi:hypothetical protein
VAFLALLPVLAAVEVSAQVSPAPAKKGFIGVSFGAQPRRQTIQTTTSLGVYQETATFDTSQPIGNGAIIDVTGGYRVWENLYVGVGFSSFSKNSDSTVTARIPSPLFFDSFKTTDFTQPNLEHKERNVYVQGMYFFDVTEKVDVAIYGGAAFIGVTQSFFGAYGVEPGTQNLTYRVDNQSVRTTGGTVGVEGTYLVRRNIGVALFARYVSGTVNFPILGDVKAGGIHAGVGARYRF